jgi:hypothetical protein
MAATNRGLRYAVLASMLIASCAYFFIRGPYRAVRGAIDLRVFYSASRAWLLGRNPYEGRDLNAVLREAGGLSVGRPSVNPPVTFVVLAPLAALPWPAADKAWIVLNVLLTGACLLAIASLLGLRLSETRTIFFLAFALALAPFHTAIHEGQLTVAVTALVVLALWDELKGKAAVTGVSIGLATALKPQMGLIFLLLSLCRRRGRVVAWAAVTLAALSVVALGRMALAGVAWLPSFLENLSTFTRGGTGDPTSANPDRLLMINLHVVLHCFTASRLVVNLLVYAFVAMIGGMALLRSRKRHGSASELLAYSVAAVLSLLGFYNRFYSATLLILPLGWAVVSLTDRILRKSAVVALLCILPFVVPGAAIMNVLTREGPAASLVASAWWWRAASFHQVYALVMLAVTLVWASSPVRDE